MVIFSPVAVEELRKFLTFRTELLFYGLNSFVSESEQIGVSMPNLPNYQQPPVNGNGLAGTTHTKEVIPKTHQGFWGNILDKTVDSPVDTRLSARKSLIKAKISRRHLRLLKHVSASADDVKPLGKPDEVQVQQDVLASAAGRTNSTQQLDLFQVSLELLQERSTLT